MVPYGINDPEGMGADPAQQVEAFYEQAPQLRGRRYLLFMARIHEKKGCDLLIDAFARIAGEVPDVDLVMAGPDQAGLQAKLQRQVEHLKISSRVHWPGMLVGDSKWGAVRGCEAFVLPSHQENFGIAVADALACGVIPLISDKVNIAPDVAGDGAGFMEPDTLQGTVNLLTRFQALSADRLAAMRQAALHCYQERYALKTAAQEVYKALGLG